MVGGRKRMSLAPPLTPGTAFRQLEPEVPMDARAAVRERVAASRDRLTALSHRIHAHPELAFEEERAAAWCAEALDAAGFAVERGVGGLPTAFVARAGSGPLHLALCAEYDCLPGIGHACGHTLIAAIAVGAGIAAALVADGGDAPNVVPAHAAADYIVRARALAELDEIRAKVLRCFEAGALATGATLEVKPSGTPYAEVQHDAALAAVYRRNAEALGRSFPDLGVLLERAAASTDMGNVSHALPSIHPMIGIASLPAVNHQPEFTAHCVTAAADQAVADGALALAWTAVDVASDPALAARLRARGQ